jgi:hypothetical protein
MAQFSNVSNEDLGIELWINVDQIKWVEGSGKEMVELHFVDGNMKTIGRAEWSEKLMPLVED